MGCGSSTTGKSPAEAKKPVEEEIDIDLDDPAVQHAATKIQATFRGHKTRKVMQEEGFEPSTSGDPHLLEY